jgi:zeta-carotene desaturase
MSGNSPKTVGIVGGGLAGLAAGCALADSGFRVTLFERRPFLGGRASSYQHPATGEVVDNCQHVLFGSCTNLIEFYKRIGVADKIRWSDTMTFIEPGGRQSVMGPSALPAPLQTAPSFMRFPFLTLQDKLSIARAFAALMPAMPKDNGRPFLDWLREHRQTPGAIERFWKPVLISALSEDLDRMSLPAAAQVVRESLKSETAGRMGIPTIPLTELYNAARDYILARNGEVRVRCGVDALLPQSGGAALSFGGENARFDFAVLALPFFALAPVLPQNGASQPLRDQMAQFETSPIAGIHLWFDRQITNLDHAVLLDRTIQWMFHKSRLLQGRDESGGSYIELVVSSSKNLIDKTKQEIVDLVLGEVREFFPEARTANLVKSTVIKELNATYSPRPGIDAHRPKQQTVWPGVYLAGDWTATGWPATMEGAVRSGYLAAEALLQTVGTEKKFIVPDEPATGLMRLFS